MHVSFGNIGKRNYFIVILLLSDHDGFCRVLIEDDDGLLTRARARARARAQPFREFARVALNSGLVLEQLLLRQDRVARGQLGQKDGYFKIVLFHVSRTKYMASWYPG